VDPPREGAPGLLGQLAVTRPKRLAYVSCHPPSLSRDLRPALAAGYRLSHLAVFDMFPQTFHVETLAVLTRNDLPT
jgi:23S rRNA (uracil1939-C5)-methyltransferase